MIHVYLNANTSRTKNFHVVRAVKNSIRWRKPNSMRRIVATEKLQEPSLQGQSDSSAAPGIFRIGLVRHCNKPSVNLCADSKTYNWRPWALSGRKIVSTDANIRSALCILWYVDCSYCRNKTIGGDLS